MTPNIVTTSLAAFGWSLAVALASPINSKEPQSTALQIESSLSPAFGECISLSGGVTAAMRDCAALEYNGLDKRLNATYRTTMARLPDDQARSRFRRLQRDWLQTRGAVCHQEVEQSGMTGGTGALLILNDCGNRVLTERIQWLERYQPE